MTDTISSVVSRKNVRQNDETTVLRSPSHDEPTVSHDTAMSSHDEPTVSHRETTVSDDENALIEAAVAADQAHSRLMNRGTLSREDAGKLARQVARWHQAGKISAKALALADAMIWTLRRDGARCIKASLSKLAEKSGMARATVARLLPVLEKLGLFRKTKVRFQIAWLGGMASRQGTSVYELVNPAEICGPHTESHGETVKIKPRLFSFMLPANWRKNEAKPDKPVAKVPTASDLTAQFAADWWAKRRNPVVQIV